MLTILMSIILLAGWSESYAQEQPDVDTWGLFNGKYTVDKAKKFEWDWEYEKAIWVYINLIDSPDKKYIIQRVKKLKDKVGDLESFINNTFDVYIQLDPEAVKTVDGKLSDVPEVFKKKRAWADELIAAVTN